MLGLVLTRLGWKTTMILGILGHAARFAVFAFMPENQPVIIVVQVLHGICYAFFFATVYIFIDAAFPKDVRSSAQGLFNLLVLGLGDLAAKWLFIPLQGKLTRRRQRGLQVALPLADRPRARCGGASAGRLLAAEEPRGACGCAALSRRPVCP